MLLEQERLAIQHLVQDIPVLWHAETTAAMDRQSIVRQLIERILVEVVDDTEKVRVEIHWFGGHITYASLDRPVAKLTQLSTYQALMDRVKDLHSQGHTAPEIAQILNAEGWKPPKQRGTYHAPMVRTVLNRQGIPMGTQNQQHSATLTLEADEWTLKDLALQLKMPEPTIYAWLKKGHKEAKRIPVAGPMVVDHHCGRGRMRAVAPIADGTKNLDKIR